ncbi:MAG: hemoglobin protein [Caulobacteraceae bacterium]|nr:hemoglobin protein [Caulobacteraceae bacterium]
MNEAMIDALVEAFYAKVRRDELLGPVFNAAVGDHWDAHLAKIKDFWSSVMLHTGRFRGSPMATHLGVPGIGAEHFERWLDLFGLTAEEVCPPAEALAFITRANLIGQSLQFGLAAARGEAP